MGSESGNCPSPGVQPEEGTESVEATCLRLMYLGVGGGETLVELSRTRLAERGHFQRLDVWDSRVPMCCVHNYLLGQCPLCPSAPLNSTQLNPRFALADFNAVSREDPQLQANAHYTTERVLLAETLRTVISSLVKVDPLCLNLEDAACVTFNQYVPLTEGTVRTLVAIRMSPRKPGTGVWTVFVMLDHASLYEDMDTRSEHMARARVMRDMQMERHVFLSGDALIRLTDDILPVHLPEACMRIGEFIKLFQCDNAPSVGFVAYDKILERRSAVLSAMQPPFPVPALQPLGDNSSGCFPETVPSVPVY